MSLSITTEPSSFSNEAIFDIANTNSEDSSHVNLRVKAELYIRGVVKATMVKPSVITEFDFTQILNDLIQFKTPEFRTYESAFKIVEPDKAGSSLITGWTNDGTDPMDTLSTSGATITSLIHDGVTNGVGKAYTNNITFDKTKTYVLVFYDGSLDSGKMPEIHFRTIEGNTIEADTSVVADPLVHKFYFTPREDGSGQIELECLATDAVQISTSEVELYELDETDWWQHYHVVFTEYYEDASGETQAGADLTTEQAYHFFKCPGVSATVFEADKLAGRDALHQKAFLDIDSGYYGGAGWKSSFLPRDGKYHAAYFAFIEDGSLRTMRPQSIGYTNQKMTVASSDGTSYGDSLVSYSPIHIVKVSVDNMASDSFTWMIRIYDDEESQLIVNVIYLAVHTERGTEVRQFSPITLYWENIVGGVSALTFYGFNEETIEMLRETYKDEYRVNRPLKQYVKRSMKLSTRNIQWDYPNILMVDLYQMIEKIADLMRSRTVWFNHPQDDSVVYASVRSKDVASLPKHTEVYNMELEIEYFFEAIYTAE
jgi:hypothetical protein